MIEKDRQSSTVVIDKVRRDLTACTTFVMLTGDPYQASKRLGQLARPSAKCRGTCDRPARHAHQQSPCKLTLVLVRRFACCYEGLGLIVFIVIIAVSCAEVQRVRRSLLTRRSAACLFAAVLDFQNLALMRQCSSIHNDSKNGQLLSQ